MTTVSESKRGQSSNAFTVISVHSCEDHSHEHIIPKPSAGMTYDDIELLRTTNDKNDIYFGRKHSMFRYLFRFSCWWLTFSGVYAISILCPCCGLPSCPVGIGSATLVGGFLAICKQSWGIIVQFIRTRRVLKA